MRARIRIGVDREGGLVPQAHVGIDFNIGARAVAGLPAAQMHAALVGQQPCAGFDDGFVVADPGRIRLAHRRAGQTVGVGRRARVEVDPRARAGLDVAGVAAYLGAGAEFDRGIAGGREVGFGRRDGHQAARIELGLVVADHLVEGVEAEAALAQCGHQPMHLCVLADARDGGERDRAAAAAGGGVERTARAGLDVPGGGVGVGGRVSGDRGRTPPELVGAVVGVDVDMVGLDAAVVGHRGLHRAFHRVAGFRTAGADRRGRHAVYLGVELAGVVGLECEGRGVEAVGGVAAAHARGGVALAEGAHAGGRARDEAAAAGDGGGDVVILAGGGDADQAGQAAQAGDLYAVAEAGVGLGFGVGVADGGARGEHAADGDAGHVGALAGVVGGVDVDAAGDDQLAVVAQLGVDLALVVALGVGGVHPGEQATRRAQRVGRGAAAEDGLGGGNAYLIGGDPCAGADGGVDVGCAGGRGDRGADAHAAGHIHADGVGVGRRATGCGHAGESGDGDAAVIANGCADRRCALGRGHRTAGGQTDAGLAGDGLGFGGVARIGGDAEAVDRADRLADLQVVAGRGGGRTTQGGGGHRGADGRAARDAHADRFALGGAVVAGRDADAGGVGNLHAVADGGAGGAVVGDKGQRRVDGEAAVAAGKTGQVADGFGVGAYRNGTAAAECGQCGHIGRRAGIDRHDADADAQTHAAHRRTAGQHFDVDVLTRVDVDGAGGRGDVGVANGGSGAGRVGAGQIARDADPGACRLRLRAGVANARIVRAGEQAVDAAVAGLVIGIAVHIAKVAAVGLEALAPFGVQPAAHAVHRHATGNRAEAARGADSDRVDVGVGERVHIHVALGRDLRVVVDQRRGVVLDRAHIHAAGRAYRAACDRAGIGVEFGVVLGADVHILRRAAVGHALVDQRAAADDGGGVRIHAGDGDRAGHAGVEAARAAGGDREQVFA